MEPAGCSVDVRGCSRERRAVYSPGHKAAWYQLLFHLLSLYTSLRFRSRGYRPALCLLSCNQVLSKSLVEEQGWLSFCTLSKI